MLGVRLCPARPRRQQSDTPASPSAGPEGQAQGQGVSLTHKPSAVMAGRFESLRCLPAHPNLTKHLAIVRAKNDRVLVVTESFPRSLASVLSGSHASGLSEESSLTSLALGLSRALATLSRLGVVSRNVCVDSVLFAEDGSAVLADWGLYHLSEFGRHVPFVVGEPQYMPPELVASGREPSGGKADVWALGVVMVAAVCGAVPWSESSDALAVLNGVLTLSTDAAVAEFLCGRSTHSPPGLGEAWGRLSSVMRDFITQCLRPDPRERMSAEELLGHPRERMSAEELLGHPLFANMPREKTLWMPKPLLKCLIPEVAPQTPKKGPTVASAHSADDQGDLSLEEAFRMWKGNGGDLELDLAKEFGFVPPVLQLGRVYRGEVSGTTKTSLYTGKTVRVTLDTLYQRLCLRKQQARRSPSPLSSSCGERSPAVTTLPSSKFCVQSLGPAYQSLVEDGERLAASLSSQFGELAENIDFQRHRVALFHELLRQRVANADTSNAQCVRAEIIRQSELGIPEIMRSELWCAILDVPAGDCKEEYSAFVVPEDAALDRQLDMDIARCHQYHQLLASPQGHAMFKRVLKAWLASHAHADLTYWQGLDSVLAPFLALDLSEARAFCALDRFVKSHLQGFYRKDNAPHLHQALLTFRQLLAYYDPVLASHLQEAGFHPSLYAIPWFMTAFAHVLPLDRIFLLWDQLLLRPTMLVFFALEVVLDMRESLLHMDFNACIALFSNLPIVDVRKCLARAVQKAQATQMSLSLLSFSMAAQLEDVSGSESAGKYWWHKPASFDERVKEAAPRITLQEMIAIAEQGGLVVDIRPASKFVEGRYPGSVNIPPVKEGENGKRAKGKGVQELEKHRGRAMVVVGDSMARAADFASDLVELQFPFVSTLQGGMECLKAEAASLLLTGE